ncbi:MAG TPA: nuclear transport factor 2 family protein, partial [Pseudomonadales bacterium]|nr:nuclear transport factor 2 family protein [Pseudomonadales bacterium]
GHTAVVEHLLAVPFEVVNSEGKTISREEWLNKLKANHLNQKIDLRSLAVHEAGDSAVASFRMKSTTDNKEQFVVDVWVPEDDHWVLQVRYLSGVK